MLHFLNEKSMVLKSTTSTSQCGGRLCNQSHESIKKQKGGKDTEEKCGSSSVVC